jgi:hypothetical protein
MTAGEARETAIRMFAADFRINTIRRYLARNGVDVSWMTVKGWIDPQWYEQQLAVCRARSRRREMRNHTYAWPGQRGPEWKMGRIRALHEAGLYPVMIARVMTTDFPEQPITGAQVKRALQEDCVPITYRTGNFGERADVVPRSVTA